MNIRRNYIASAILFGAFVLLTLLVLKVDVQPIGPEESKIGLATINHMVNESLGSHMIWYKITEYTGYVSLLVAAGFGIIGLVQLVKRRSLFKVDKDILLLGGFYVLVMGTYALFEKVVINYRPIIMDEGLEPSFPSTHSLLVVAIMGTAVYQIGNRVKQTGIRNLLRILAYVIIVVTVIGRLVSGVLLADAYIMLYYAIARTIED